MDSTVSASFRTLVARVSPEDIVIYANGALAAYLKVRKRDLIGSPLEVLAQRARGEISSCFARPESGRASNHLVTDEEGRVFEAKSYSDGGVLDIVLDEVTTADAVGRELRGASGTPFESLSEEELRTTRHPERRYLTVSYTHLRGVAAVAERLAPMEVRLMVNSFVEEAGDAVLDAGCTVGETSGDSVLGIYGAPRYYADHPLRAVRAACDQMQKAAALHAGLYREGKELPPCSAGLWTGETLVGTLGNSAWQHYTALGTPVNLAVRLAELARPGEIVLPEHTLTHLLRVLPEGWEHLRAEGEAEPDLSDFQWTGDDVLPVPDHLRRIIYLVGPGVQEDPNRVEFYFDYLWAFRVPGRDQEIPILRVMRPTQVGDSLELRSDNVVTNQAAQTLGKYKLIEVIGVGGMGKVWRGVDRFGNSVAIKVLHSNETVTEAQLKRFRREAEIMARLPHRNICRVFEMNEYESIHYIAMEFVDGLSLSDLLYEKTSAESSGQSKGLLDLRALIHSLRSEKSLRAAAEREAAERGEEPPARPRQTRVLPVEQSLTLILKVCDAVQFAHEHGVLHRDLKPGNILLREDGEPLVADFGLAKLSSSDATQSLSMTGHVVGTLENMSPEQAESSKDVDERADVYSLGTILFQMLTGRRHFEATGNIVADAQALQAHEPPRLRVFNPQIDSDLEIITLKALRNDPAERYRNVAALRTDLERYRRGEVISARPVSWPEVTRKMIQRNKGIATVVLASGFVFFISALVALWHFVTLLGEKTRVANELQANKVLVDEKEAQLKEQEQKIAEKEAEAQDRATKAELADKNARLQEELAKRALAELQAAQTEAAAKISQAQAETEAEKQRREEAERGLTVVREKLNETRETPAVLPVLGGWRRHEDPFAMRQLNQALEDANLILQTTAFNAANTDRDADAITSNLGRAVGGLSDLLVENRNFTPAWVLKAKLHLALMEWEQAAESFAEAARAAQEGTFAPPPNINPREVADVAATWSRLSDPSDRVVEYFRASIDPQDKSTVLVIDGLKKRLRDAGQLRLPRRTPRPSEAVLALTARNGENVRAHVENNALILWGTETFNDLSPLKDLPVKSLAIIGAQSLDWTTLLSLPVESLDLSRGRFESCPITRGSLPTLKSLKLSGTPITSVEFVRFLPNLASLDISDTHVTDVFPLRENRRITQLDIAGLDPANLKLLMWVPLQSLTVSPMLISDRAALNAFRTLRTLRVVRAPSDAPDQPALEFWRKLDSGGYSEAQ